MTSWNVSARYPVCCLICMYALNQLLRDICTRNPHPDSCTRDALSEQDRLYPGHTRHASSAANRTLVVLGGLARREDLDGREALDAVLAARRLVGLRVAVNRHHVDDAV